ncbi:MAG: hypothetical protein L3J25_02110 [Flavobacteriaceae bacterium]|nr:hypothetical protein [Flavobacteriaceae bacterium]
MTTNQLNIFGNNVTNYDTLTSLEVVKYKYNLETIRELPSKKFDAVLLKVEHSEFLEEDLLYLLNPKVILYKVKMFLTKKILMEEL